MLPRAWPLVEQAARADINLTIDAEESDRLERSLDVFDALAARVALQWPAWRGFGLAIQAYQTRALDVVNEVARIARAQGLRFMVRLVKGAYWDAEIKRAQELGLQGYPVYTHKQHTDLSYLACARAMLNHADVIYPQFATHNAGTIAAIAQMAQPSGARFELQRLHGMGAGVYREVTQDASVRVRVYAPVGEHRDLLAYLVRRLLENGANSSFVHQLADEAIAVDQVAPIAFEVARIADVAQEIFGPVLHVVRWRGDPAAVISQINALGCGLTLGLQTRIDSRALHLAEAARVGNVYVTRNTTGAVVGVQPFGGEGLSGTGPKAGGPHYLLRFCAEQTLTVNTAAACGNAELLSRTPPASGR